MKGFADHDQLIMHFLHYNAALCFGFTHYNVTVYWFIPATYVLLQQTAALRNKASNQDQSSKPTVSYIQRRKITTIAYLAYSQNEPLSSGIYVQGGDA